MIQHLNGDFETVEYRNNGFVLLYDNTENEDYPMHWHNALEIIMPLSNSFSVTVSDETYNLKEREIIIIPPGELHSMSAPEKGQRIIFQCDSAVLNDFPAMRPIASIMSDVSVIENCSEDRIKTAARKTLLEIYDEYAVKNELSELKIYLKLVSMFIEIYESKAAVKLGQLGCTTEKLDEYSERFGTVQNYIEKNYMYDITLDKLAYVAGYSKYHFSRIFKQYFGVSFSEYINRIRINAAQKLLLDPSVPITEVALNSGFTNIASFNRVFKEFKHCTPSEYKKFYKNTD